MFRLGLKLRERRVVFLGLVSALAVAVVGLASAPVASATSCGSPNYYAGAIKNGSDQYGARGYIKSVNIQGVPNDGFSFSDQAFHAVPASGNGLEVGWYVGWGSDAQTFVISPHAYATLNGPHEVDGPAVGQTTDWYSTYWDGTTQQWLVRQNQGGTLIWSGSQAASSTGPGTIFGVGEVNFLGGIMTGEFQGAKPADSTPLGTYNGSTWQGWVSITLCNSPGYSAAGTKTDYTDSTN